MSGGKSRINNCILAVNMLHGYLTDGDLEGWIDMFYSDDDIGISAQRKWFESYRKKNIPKYLDTKILFLTSIDESTICADLDFTFQYDKYQSRNEKYRFTIRWIDELSRCKVIWMERIKERYVTEKIYDIGEVDLNCGKFENQNMAWWRNLELIRCINEEENSLSHKLYARSISRTIRFRESHPFLEGASLLVNMMSWRVISIAKQLYDKNRHQLLANLHNALSTKMVVSLVREDRNNSWISKYLVPWYGYDELYAMKDSMGKITGNCQMVMGIYYAVLRLCGVPCQEIFLIRLENHEAMIVRDGRRSYFMNADELTHLTDDFLFYSNKVDKIYNEKWIFTSSGITNLTGEQLELFKCYTKTLPFVFQDRISTTIGSPIINENDIPGICEFNLNEFYSKVLTYVFENSVWYPDSAFTWGKYAYQTLYVSRPQVYLYWSVQSTQVRSYTESISDMGEIKKYLKKLGNHSIFSENNRIMTADQVLRHGTGNILDKTVLLYAWYYLKINQICGVCIMESDTYFVFEKEESIWFYNLEIDLECTGIKGAIVLAFDNEKSYCADAGNIKINEKNAFWINVFQMIER